MSKTRPLLPPTELWKRSKLLLPRGRLVMVFVRNVLYEFGTPWVLSSEASLKADWQVNQVLPQHKISQQKLLSHVRTLRRVRAATSPSPTCGW
jgi:hypothetical protein